MSFILEKRKKSNKINRLQMKVFFLPNTSKRTGEQPRRSQKTHFATLLKLHPHTDVSTRIHSTSAEHLSLGEHLWGTASVCQKSFKRLKL